MAGRRKRFDMTAFIGLDSLMDIVTNVIGAVFFLLVYVVLSASGAKGKVTTPILSEGDTTGIFFECRGNTVLFPDVEGLLKQFDKAFEDMEAKNLGGFDEKIKFINDRNIRNKFYRFEMAVTDNFFQKSASPSLAPVEGSVGENAFELAKETSEFRRQLARLDPAKQHVFFLVRTDSYEVFHTARREAIRAGLRVGWDPMEAGGPIRFGSGGVVNPNATY